ncbi:MAG: carbamoyltransferase HypF [Chloroflexi bacterium]|nr:MAG: carbamoyltransferase HypF [Chloroflexota bacterium]
MNIPAGKHIHITGIVQGVGFRPFVYGLAIKHALTGWVRNTSAGVDIEVNGPVSDLEAFVVGLRTETPPLAQIDTMDVAERPFTHTPTFKIVHSEAVAGAFQPISPDMCICPDCLREVLDPTDRRYLYPFINCTNCGPRFTIIKDIPYDRPLTTMAPFEMCEPCAEEYNNPLDRRFHAQPVACAECGPHVWIEKSQQSTVNSQQSTKNGKRKTENGKQDSRLAIETTREMLANGRILAIKGLGGFHLACDAENETAVTTLRERKLRREKAFAVMMPDLETVKQHCIVNEAEAELLTSRERPIVILQRQPESTITPLCTPGQDTLGVMLPYTPLHYLLFTQSNNQQSTINNQQLTISALVMTSGNLSEEPIAYTNEDARKRLSDLADAFLLHNRDIHVRCDDSVMRVLRIPDSVNREPFADNSQQSTVNGQRATDNRLPITDYRLPFRRSRGYAPFPVKLPWDVPPILGAGAELKNTFCVANGRYAFLSHHIGDLENYETLQSFEEGVAHFEQLFRVNTELIAYDKHPNYLATRYALERAEQENIPTIGVQHHHAHIAACMAEHGLTGDEPVIGLSFDGTGYGDDGTIWGGEVMVADYAGFERPFHLQPVPLPGGDKAVREPWRMALSWLQEANIDWADDLPPVQLTINNQQLTILRHQLKTGINSPLTSSMGRLFDAVSALIGIRQTVNYEAQAAIEMEAMVDPHETGAYDIPLHENIIDPSPMLHQIVQELRDGVSQATIAARFHNGLVETAVTICQSLKTTNGINNVVLSGGVWQNMTLFSKTVSQLQKNHFDVYSHQKVPTNDGGLALGQVAIAAYQMTNLT